MAFFRWKVQKDYGLTVQVFYKGGRIVQVCALFRLRHVAPLALPCGRTCALAPFRQKGRSRAFSAPFAPSRAPLPPVLGWLGFPHAAPPATPLQNPLPSGYSVNFMGGSLLGETHFRRGNLALLNPCGGGQWACARLASWRVLPKRHPQEKGKRKGKQDNQPLQGAVCACSGTQKFSDTTPRQGCEAPRSGTPLTRFGFEETMTHREGSDRRKNPSLSIPVRNCRLLFYGMNCIIIQRR